jgi:nicotinamidase/pyrazinamidase
MDVRLIGIDWQNDFCDPTGSLYVQGAEEDAKRCAAMVKRLGKKITQIHATLDSHHFVDIAHPIFLINSEGKHPTPFTIITAKDMEDGVWRATNPQFQKRALEYAKKLEDNARYPWCIWPPHCLIGSWGYGVIPVLFNEFRKWEENFKMVDYVTKGSNFWTEHYSAIQADVPDPEDPGTMLNTNFITTLESADIIALTGQALSHCLANTVRDIANNFGEENTQKLVLLRDCTSSVGGFEQMGEDFIDEMTGRGMKLSTSTEFLA